MITKEQLKNSGDKVLLDLIDQAKTLHVTGKDFAEKFDCEFSYSFLTTELKNRGYTCDWYKPADVSAKDNKISAASTPPKIVELHPIPSECQSRIILSVEESTHKRWIETFRNYPYKSTINTAALELFLEGFQSDEVEFRV